MEVTDYEKYTRVERWDCVTVSRNCFPEELAVKQRKALVKKYIEKYAENDIIECPVCRVESALHMSCALKSIEKEMQENKGTKAR